MESPVLNLYTTKCFLLPQFVGSLFFCLCFFFLKEVQMFGLTKKKNSFVFICSILMKYFP